MFIFLQEHLITCHKFQKIAQSLSQLHRRKVATEYKSLIQLIPLQVSINFKVSFILLTNIYH